MWRRSSGCPELQKLLLVATTLAPALPARAQTVTTRDDARATHHAVATRLTVEVDGRMDEPAWAAATPIELPFEVAPGDNVAAPVETECRVTHDGERLLVGCNARDPTPSRIRAYVTERDAVAGQDRIEVTLVPFDDGRRGYRFVVTPLGLQADAQVAPDGDDGSWNAAWVSAGTLDSGGYTVEIAIPFVEMRFPAGDGAWGMRIERHWPRETDVRLRSVALDRRDACDLCQTARLTGLAGITTGGALRLTPAVTTTRASAGAVGGGVEAEVGADLLWTPVPAVAVGAAVNPDFSHVEADEARLEANERFALLLPERRSLFLEGADLFATPMRVFFSRSIADPDAAVKLTAKAGGTGVGVILAHDAQTNVVLPGRDGSTFAATGGSSNVAVLRVRQDVRRASSIGLTATSRTGESYSNQVGSLDALLRPVPSVTMRLQVAGSTTEDSPLVESGRVGRFGGLGATASVRRATREWILTGMGFWRSDGLRLDAGFEPQMGLFGFDGGIRRVLLAGRDSWYQRMSLATGGFQVRRDDGGLLSRGAWIGGEYDGPRELLVRVYLNAPEQLTFGGTTYDTPTLFTALSMRPHPALRIGSYNTIGKAVDFAAGESAALVELRPSVEAKLGRRVDLLLAHSRRGLRRAGETVLLARALEVRALYGITARASLRLIGQLESVSRPPTGDETSQSLLQGLFSYQLDSQSVIRLGFSASDEADAGTTTLLFLKVAYAWRP